jgi:hypothetical protein
MNKITRSIIDTLAQEQDHNVLTIYMPTHRYPSPPHIQENQTRFKNMLRDARSIAKDDKEAVATLQELEKKIDDLDFLKETTESLAMFIDNGHTQFYNLPIECEESIRYGRTYDITPLVMLHSYDQPFYVLALALHGSKLYKGDVYGIEELQVDFPKSPEDALNIDEMFSGSQTKRSHQGGPNAPNGVTGPHGEGDSNAAGSQERLMYFGILDKLIAEHDEFDVHVPLMIAGAESEAGTYRANTKLPNVMGSFLKGNYTNLTSRDIHAKVWPLICQEIVYKREHESLERYEELKGVDKSSTKLNEIETAADSGRVDTFFIHLIDQTHDSVSDAADQSAPLIRSSNNEDESRLKKLVDAVYRTGGHIIGLTSSKMPEGAPAAAVYRY